MIWCPDGNAMRMQNTHSFTEYALSFGIGSVFILVKIDYMHIAHSITKQTASDSIDFCSTVKCIAHITLPAICIFHFMASICYLPLTLTPTTHTHSLSPSLYVSYITLTINLNWMLTFATSCIRQFIKSCNVKNCNSNCISNTFCVHNFVYKTFAIAVLSHCINRVHSRSLERNNIGRDRIQRPSSTMSFSLLINKMAIVFFFLSRHKKNITMQCYNRHHTLRFICYI